MTPHGRIQDTDVIRDSGMNHTGIQIYGQRGEAGKNGTKIVERDDVNMVNKTMKKKTIPARTRRVHDA